MQDKPTDAERRSPTSPTGRLVGAALVVAGVLIAALVISPLLRPRPAEPTPAPTLAQAPPTVPSAVPSPTTAASAPPTPAPAPATPMVAPTTPILATRTPPPSSPTAQPAGTPTEGRYLGRDPLPAGVDLTNGPFLKDLKARGYPGVNVGDGGLGDELKAAYLAALKVEEEALNNNDDSRIRDYFTGEALERLQRLIDRGKASTDNFADLIKLEPRVMEFIPTTSQAGVYEVVDARTQTISLVRKLPDGQPSPVVKAGEPERVCYSVQMLKEGNRWKVEFEEAHHDGPNGHKCPPGWS
jgi:hypothetical protein